MSRYSIVESSWRYQLSMAFALMTIIPFLTFGYFLSTYLLPNVMTRENLLLIVIVNLFMATTGLILLQRLFRAFTLFRGYVKAVATGDLSQAFPSLAGPEFMEIAGSLQRIVRTLRNDRDHAMDFARQLEQQVAQRTAELQETNTRLADTLSRVTHMQEELMRKDRARDGAPVAPAAQPEATQALLAAARDIRDMVSELRKLQPAPGGNPAPR